MRTQTCYEHALFDVIVYPAEERVQKPNPEIYGRTLEHLEWL